MRISRHLPRLGDRPYLPRWTIRLRLAALYGLLFTLAGAGLLVITNVLVRSTAAAITCRTAPHSDVFCTLPDQHFPHSITFGSGLRFSISGGSQARELTLLANSGSAVNLHHLLVYSCLSLAIMVVLSTALGWLVAGRVLRPLRTIITTARNISATSLHKRIALSGPNDELKELGDTFDGLLERLEQFIQSQRQFVANASHELRTPLALQRTLIQVALSDPDANVDSLRAAHERVLVSGRQQERLIEALLTLTRGQAGLAKQTSFDLAILAKQVLLTREAEARRRSIEVHSVVTSTPVIGDPRLIERLVANLVDNALAYNSVPGQIELTTECRGKDALLLVTNSGPVIDGGAIERLTQPFERLATERSGEGEGSGLGLSIVQAIVNAHHGALLIRPQPGGGLMVEVTLPGGDVVHSEGPLPMGSTAGETSP